MVERVYVWDIFVRLFHWSFASAFLINAVIINPETSVHQWIGYGIAALVALRILWGFIGSTHARFSNFRPSISASIEQLGEIASARSNAHAGHSPLGALMIYNLLLTIVAICLTGYMMTTLIFFGAEWVQEAHAALVTWAEISVLIHVGAVLLESRRLNVNLIKSMIAGYKNLSR
jgi:cytochrome b